MSKKAVVLLSGGMDSATVLAVARDEGFDVHALTFDYGQRHIREIECAKKTAAFLRAVEHRVVKLDIAGLASSALTGAGEVPKGRTDMGGDIPATYVPARNLIFLSCAAAWAESLGCSDIFIGISCTDYSGYPDCRPEFVESFQATVNLATGAGTQGQVFTVHAPFMHAKKADIIRRGSGLGVDYSLTHSCYDPTPEDGPCGACDSCQLRRRAFQDSGVPDPLEPL